MNKRNKQTTGKPATEEQMICYFTGELSPEERCELEEHCFADDKLFEELQAIEAELTHEYVSGVLTGRRREEFALHLQRSQQGSDEVILSQMMVKTASKPLMPKAIAVPLKTKDSWLAKIRFIRLPTNYLWQFGFTALVVTATASLLFIWWGLKRQTNSGSQEASAEQTDVRANLSIPPAASSSSESVEPGNQAQTKPPTLNSVSSRQSNLQTATPERSKKSKPLTSQPEQKASTQSSSPIFVSMILTPGSERSSDGATNKLRLPLGVDKVQLRLLIETDDYNGYEAVIRSVANREVWRQKNLLTRLTKDGRILTLQMPVSIIPNGTLLLTLSGTTKQGKTEETLGYVIYVTRQ